MAKVRLVQTSGETPRVEIDPDVSTYEELMRELAALPYSGPASLPLDHPVVQQYVDHWGRVAEAFGRIEAREQARAEQPH